MSGLVGEIRNCTASEQFDLANYTEQRARDLIIGAFSSALSAPTQMIRFTFIVGGGKLVRSRYDDDLSRWICAALRDISFTEDKSAAETFDSQGTYKQQHDTGQNLKYVIVFPRVECADRKAEAEDTKDELDTKSNEYVIAASSLEMFKNIVASKTQTWHQKKAFLKVLLDSCDEFKRIEAKLISGSPLSPKEQALYDANGGEDDAKVAWLQTEIKAMADGGGLTSSEKKEAVETICTNIASVDEEIAKAKADGDDKKVSKLEEKRAAMVARRTNIEKNAPAVHRFKKGEEIRKLRLRLLPLIALEEKGRSMALTMADLKTLEEKSEIEDAITLLETASRGWYLPEEDYLSMCRIEMDEAAKKYKEVVKAQAAKAAKMKPAAGSSGWSTMGGSVKKASGSGAKPSGLRSGNSFASAFDNDSD